MLKVFHVDDMLQQCQLGHSSTISSSSPQYEQLRIDVSGFYIDPGVNQEHNLEKKVNLVLVIVNCYYSFLLIIYLVSKDACILYLDFF